jgi:hypothetical protein
VGAILEPSRTLGSKQSREGAASTHRDVGPDGDDDAVLDVDVGLLRPVRVHHRAALDQDPRAVPSTAAAGVTPRRAELPSVQPNPATSGNQPEPPNVRRPREGQRDRAEAHPPRAPDETPRRRRRAAAAAGGVGRRASSWPAMPAEWSSGEAEQMRLESRRRSSLGVSCATSYLTIEKQLGD